MVRAPYSGVITKRFNDEGIYLSNVFRGGTESSVLQIQENHIVVAVVYAPEQHLGSLKLNQKALVYVESQPEPRETYILVLNDMLDVGARTDLYEVSVASFAAAVSGDGEPAVSGLGGTQAVATAMAVATAAETGATVDVVDVADRLKSVSAS